MNLNQVYAKKDKSDTSIKVRKTFMVDLDRIFIKEGHNIRDIDQEHVDEFAEAYTNGTYIPPIVVVEENGMFYPDDGHHRYYGAVKAGVKRLECVDSVGDESDRTILMITSSQGLSLKPMERAKGYLRLQRQGLTVDEIAERCHRSRVDVDNHLLLLTSGEEVQQAVANKEIGIAAAVKVVRKHGSDAGKVVTKAVSETKASGKKKVTLSSVQGFSNTEALAVVKIISGLEPDVIEQLGLAPTTKKKLNTLLNKYRKDKSKGKKKK